MPQHHPEDRVRVKNIVSPGDPKETFFLNRLKKVPHFDQEGRETTRQVPYVQEIEWDFANGFFFIWGGQPYRMAPGETKTYYRFIADHCVKNQVQHELNKRLMASRYLTADGQPRYKDSILTDRNLRKQLHDQIVVGVDEWYVRNDDDFDAIVSREFGGGAQEFVEGAQVVDKNDTLLPEEELDDVVIPMDKPKRHAKTTDEAVAKLREEADSFGVDYADSDSAEDLKAKLVKAMG